MTDISRTESCGCKSFLLVPSIGFIDTSIPDEEVWVMEASCPKHLQLFEKMNDKIEKHIAECHGDATLEP